MPPIETIATIFAILILIKILIIFLSPKTRIKIAESFFKQPTLLTIIYLLLALIIGYYVFTNLNIIQIAVVMFFTSILIGLGFIPYSKIMIKLIKETERTRYDFLRKNWFIILVWVGIAVWVLYEVFLSFE